MRTLRGLQTSTSAYQEVPFFVSHSSAPFAEDEAASESRTAAATVDDETLFALLRAAREAGMQLSRGEAADMLATRAVPPAVQGTPLPGVWHIRLRVM